MILDQASRQPVARAKLEQLFRESSRHVWLFWYSIAHRAALLAIHDGFPFRQWPLTCWLVSTIEGPTWGGPYNLEIVPEDGGWRLRFGDGRLVVRCEAFDLGDFRTVRSPEVARLFPRRTEQTGALQASGWPPDSKGGQP